MKRLLLLLLALGALAPGAVRAQEDRDDSTPLYEKGLELQRRGRWMAAKRVFRKLLAEYPDSIHWREAEARSGDNAYLGTMKLFVGGPPANRVDVSVMGDGFTIEARDQALEEKWAKLCLQVLRHEKVYAEYRDYFNFYFVRLASLEEGVDPMLSPEERKRIEERNRRRARKRKTDYETALDCKAAGPQGQVMANPNLVFQWLAVAEEDVPGCGDDAQVIAFARFGRLGMGGAGIANVGRPDRSVTVHEFGHSFVGLADEYAVSPGPPPFPIRAPNAATTSDPEKVPWAHFLRKKVKGVGIYEGAATFLKGAFRPARTCAMNSAGATAYCPVCREAAVLAIYRTVNPIDEIAPDPATTVTAVRGDDTVLSVVPMCPASHSLLVEWFVAPLREGEACPRRKKRAAPGSRAGDGRGGRRRRTTGARARPDRVWMDEPPPGEPSRLARTEKIGKGRRVRHLFPVGRLEPGRFAVTVVVRDPTSWVLKDDLHLLEERATFEVVVRGDE